MQKTCDIIDIAGQTSLIAKRELSVRECFTAWSASAPPDSRPVTRGETLSTTLWADQRALVLLLNVPVKAPTTRTENKGDAR